MESASALKTCLNIQMPGWESLSAPPVSEWISRMARRRASVIEYRPHPVKGLAPAGCPRQKSRTASHGNRQRLKGAGGGVGAVPALGNHRYQAH